MDAPRGPRPNGLAIAALAACIGLVVAACGGPNGLRNDALDRGPSDATPGSNRPDGSPFSSARVGSSTQGGELATAAPPYVPPGSRDTVDKRLAVTVDGQSVYITNGGQILLGDGLAVELYLDPYPPSALRSTLDVYLTRDGRALADAGVEIAYDMLAMAHGPFSVEAKKIGGGHYLIALDYIMFGPWEQTITIRIGLQRIRLPILVVAYP